MLNSYFGYTIQNSSGKPEARIHILPSEIRIGQTTWDVTPADIVYADRLLSVSHLTLGRGDQLITIMKRSNQNYLMLYSQKQDYVFDLTYACHEATELYQEFQRQQLPFKSFMNKTNGEIARYDSLINSLQAMPTNMQRMSDAGHQHTQHAGRQPFGTGGLYPHIPSHRATSLTSE